MLEQFSSALSKKVPKGERSQFAKKIGVSYETVRVWCNGESLPATIQLVKIAEILGVSIDYLLTGKTVSRNPQIFDPELIKAYPFLNTIVPRIRRAAREKRSAYTLAGVIQKLMEAERIDLSELPK